MNWDLFLVMIILVNLSDRVIHMTLCELDHSDTFGSHGEDSVPW